MYRRRVWVPPRLSVRTSIRPELSIAVMFIDKVRPGIPPMLPLKKCEPMMSALQASAPMCACEPSDENGLPNVKRLLLLILFTKRLTLFVPWTPLLHLLYLPRRLGVPLPRTPMPVGPTLMRPKKAPYTNERQSLGRLLGSLMHLLTPNAMILPKEIPLVPPSVTSLPHAASGAEFAGSFSMKAFLVVRPPPTRLMTQCVV